MTEAIKLLLPHIQNLPLFKEYDFRLIGGTALSYHLGHRLSEDLDFCILERLPRKSIDQFIEYCIDKFGAENITFIEHSKGSLIDFEINMEDINDYSQNWMINNVKVTFFDGADNGYIRDIFKQDKLTEIGNIKVSSVDSIFKMKSLMFYKRAKTRDYFDLFYMYAQNNKNHSIENTLALVHKYDPAYLDFDLFLQKIKYPNYNEKYDEPLFGLVDVPESFMELSKKMLSLVENVDLKNVEDIYLAKFSEFKEIVFSSEIEKMSDSERELVVKGLADKDGSELNLK